ncbi:MAG: acyl-CoA thioesterase [Actinobacteria bacterium]|jgi:2-aminobenzoate-CoA ligase|nr:acyl-CoA thioesterase [Actinomycetota bacterium]
MSNSNAGASVEIIRFLEWDETDAAGHHHYASVFRWVEELEAKLYRDLGLPVTLFGQIPRVKVQMEYRRRIFFGEVVRTQLNVIRVGNSSMELDFKAFVGDEIAAEGNYIIVHSPDKETGSKPWPAEWKKKFLNE